MFNMHVKCDGLRPIFFYPYPKNVVTEYNKNIANGNMQIPAIQP